MTDEFEFEIEVTQLDIDLGVRRSPSFCPIATAIGRRLQDATNISVAAPDIRLSIGDKRLIYNTPELAGRYLIGFDAGEPGAFKPMKLTLSHPIVAERKSQQLASRLIAKSKPRSGESKRTRGRIFGERALLVNQRTIDDDLKEYDQIKARVRGKVAS